MQFEYFVLCVTRKKIIIFDVHGRESQQNTGRISCIKLRKSLQSGRGLFAVFARIGGCVPLFIQLSASSACFRASWCSSLSCPTHAVHMSAAVYIGKKK